MISQYDHVSAQGGPRGVPRCHGVTFQLMLRSKDLVVGSALWRSQRVPTRSPPKPPRGRHGTREDPRDPEKYPREPPENSTPETHNRAKQYYFCFVFFFCFYK